MLHNPHPNSSGGHPPFSVFALHPHLHVTTVVGHAHLEAHTPNPGDGKSSHHFSPHPGGASCERPPRPVARGSQRPRVLCTEDTLISLQDTTELSSTRGLCMAPQAGVSGPRCLPDWGSWARAAGGTGRTASHTQKATAAPPTASFAAPPGGFQGFDSEAIRLANQTVQTKLQARGKPLKWLGPRSARLRARLCPGAAEWDRRPHGPLLERGTAAAVGPGRPSFSDLPLPWFPCPPTRAHLAARRQPPRDTLPTCHLCPLRSRLPPRPRALEVTAQTPPDSPLGPSGRSKCFQGSSVGGHGHLCLHRTGRLRLRKATCLALRVAGQTQIVPNSPMGCSSSLEKSSHEHQQTLPRGSIPADPLHGSSWPSHTPGDRQDEGGAGTGPGIGTPLPRPWDRFPPLPLATDVTPDRQELRGQTQDCVPLGGPKGLPSTPGERPGELGAPGGLFPPVFMEKEFKSQGYASPGRRTTQASGQRRRATGCF